MGTVEGHQHPHALGTVVLTGGLSQHREGGVDHPLAGVRSHLQRGVVVVVYLVSRHVWPTPTSTAKGGSRE